MFLLFFFFKQKTAYEMRISDWSSDVCSSDLTLALPAGTYDIAAPLRVQRRLTIAGAKDAKPVLRVASGLARIESGGGLRLENLAVDASAASGDGALIAVAAGVAPNYSIAIENVSVRGPGKGRLRSDENTSELQSLMRISYAVFC